MKPLLPHEHRGQHRPDKAHERGDDHQLGQREAASVAPEGPRVFAEEFHAPTRHGKMVVNAAYTKHLILI